MRTAALMLPGIYLCKNGLSVSASDSKTFCLDTFRINIKECVLMSSSPSVSPHVSARSHGMDFVKFDIEDLHDNPPRYSSFG